MKKIKCSIYCKSGVGYLFRFILIIGGSILVENDKKIYQKKINNGKNNDLVIN